MVLNKVLMNLLRERGLTLDSLASEIRVPYSTLCDWIAGRTPRNFSALRRCAEYFGVSLHFLIFGEEDPHCTPLREILTTEAPSLRAVVRGQFQLVITPVVITGVEIDNKERS